MYVRPLIVAGPLAIRSVVFSVPPLLKRSGGSGKPSRMTGGKRFAQCPRPAPSAVASLVTVSAPTRSIAPAAITATKRCAADVMRNHARASPPCVRQYLAPPRKATAMLLLCAGASRSAGDRRVCDPAPMDAGTVLLLASAGFAAGAVNAVGGGGALISFPALLAAGYPSVTANVTNSVALLPGYLGGSLAYRPELVQQRDRIRRLAPTAVLGAAAGAALLLVSPASVFEAIVPWLILAACALLAVQPRAAASAQRRRDRGGPAWELHAGLFAATVYGGYFGAGLGIVILALLGALLPDDMQRLNALKGLLSLLVAVVSAVGFVLFGPVAWDAALVVGLACLPGGVAGVLVARRLPAVGLRAVVIAFRAALAT